MGVAVPRDRVQPLTFTGVWAEETPHARTALSEEDIRDRLFELLAPVHLRLQPGRESSALKTYRPEST